MAKLEIFDNSLIKLIVRKGSNSDRIRTTLSEGEPGYTVDTKRLYIGDGSTVGGNVVGNKFLGYTTNLTSLPTVPGVVGDIAYDSAASTLYYIQTGVGTIVTDWVSISTNINVVSYNSLYSLVRSTSAAHGAGYAVTTSISAKANNVYSTVNSKSASWDTAYTYSSSIPHYALIYSISGNVLTGTNGSYNPTLSTGSFVSYFSDFYIDEVILTARRPPIDGFGNGEIEVNVYVANTLRSTLTMGDNQTSTFETFGLPVGISRGERIYLNVTYINTLIPVQGLNLYIKGRLVDVVV